MFEFLVIIRPGLEHMRDRGFLTGTRDSLVKSFSGWSYYCMTSKQEAQKIASRIMNNARDKIIPSDNPAYQDVLDLLKKPSIFRDGQDTLDLMCRLSEPPESYDN